MKVTERDQVVAKVVPAKPTTTPDFLGRAKAVWGDVPPGKPPSALPSEGREEESWPILTPVVWSNAIIQKAQKITGSLPLVLFGISLEPCKF